MNLTIFGGTGRTGRHVVTLALQAGHGVTVLARDPSKLAANATGLRVVQGEISDASAVAAAVRGADAVISVLGPTSNDPGMPISEGMANIIGAMSDAGVDRLIVSIGAGVNDPLDKPGLVDKLFGAAIKRASPNVYADMMRVDSLVRASDLDWTIVRVPRLTDGPAKGAVRVGYLGQGVGTSLTRADMAQAILDQLEGTAYLKKAPCFSN